MKRKIAVTVCILCMFSFSACGSREESKKISDTARTESSSVPKEERTEGTVLPQSDAEIPEKKTENGVLREDIEMKLKVQVKEQTFLATLEQNTTAEAFAELLLEEPLSILMSDYAGFEKVGSLETALPADNRHMTTRKGDIVLYNGNQIVVFYGSNTWNYTKIGRIDDLSGWDNALGKGDVTVVFSVEGE